jgi:hypothetical protein
MPWSAGLFTRTDGTRTGTTVWQQAKAALVGILASSHDAHDQDLATGINACLLKDGSNAATANLNAGSNKITALATGTVGTDAINLNQITGVFQPLNSELTALAAGASTGLIARTTTATYVERTITGSAGLTVTNGDGVSGNPTISFTNAAQAAVAVLSATSQAVTASSSTLSVDLSLGHVVNLTLNATVTSFSFSNAPTTGVAFRVVINIANGGAYNITGWPGSTNYWVGGTAPTITSGSGAKDTIILSSTDAASHCRNFVVGQNMS